MTILRTTCQLLSFDGEVSALFHHACLWISVLGGECGVEGYRTALIIGWRKSLERERESEKNLAFTWLLVPAEGSLEVKICIFPSSVRARAKRDWGPCWSSGLWFTLSKMSSWR